jgi:hypothetical protein
LVININIGLPRATAVASSTAVVPSATATPTPSTASTVAASSTSPSIPTTTTTTTRRWGEMGVNFDMHLFFLAGTSLGRSLGLSSKVIRLCLCLLKFDGIFPDVILTIVGFPTLEFRD